MLLQGLGFLGGRKMHMHSKSASSQGRSDIRHLAELAYAQEFTGDMARRTGAYIDVCEDSSTGSTIKLPAEVELCKMSIVLELKTVIYIIEIKYRSTGKIALQQIKENQYYKPYLLRQKTIILLGINFNEETRMVDNWEYEIHEEHLEE